MLELTDRMPVGHVVRREDRRSFTTDWSGPSDWLNAPPNYDDFAQQYLNYTRGRCVKFGIPSYNLEDVTIEIITRFIERDFLPVFDSEFKTIGVQKGTSPRASFRSWYSKFIFVYCQGKKRNSVRLAIHEPCVLDAPVGESDGVTYGDLLTLDWHDDITEEIEARDFARRLRVRASKSASVAPALVDAVVLLSMTLSRPPRPVDVARVAGCTPQAARRGLTELARLATELIESDAA